MTRIAGRAWWSLLRGLSVGLLLCAVSAGTLRAQSESSFDGWLNGADGYERALENRRGTSDPVLVYFYTDWCPYCRRFNQQIVPSPQMQDYVRHAIAVRVNPEAGARERALADQFHVAGYLSLFVIAPGAEQPEEIPLTGDSPEEFVAACEAAGHRR